jgi:hypothetical protein
MANWKMKGQYLKNCNCLASCPCDTTGFPAPHPFCEGMAGMHIQEGSFAEVDLSGLKWVASYHWPGALHEGNGTLEAFVDERATEAQRNALLTILTGQAGGTFFEILAQIVTTVHGPHFVKIEWEYDKEKRLARVAIPGFLETTSEPLTVPPTGDEQRVIVRIPGGFEYKEMEVAQTGILKGTGEIKYDWQHTHSSLAEVEHTPTGLAH